MKKKFDIAEVHAEITEGLIALMESGVAPWSKPWIVRGRDDAMMPRNGISNRVYRV
jgi:antirestriction protein ArdC